MKPLTGSKAIRRAVDRIAGQSGTEDLSEIARGLTRSTAGPGRVERETGTWVVRDEYGRLHYRHCLCLLGLDDGPRRRERCSATVPLGFATQGAAEAQAVVLEARQGYGCMVVELQRGNR